MSDKITDDNVMKRKVEQMNHPDKNFDGNIRPIILKSSKNKKKMIGQIIFPVKHLYHWRVCDFKQ